MKLLDARVNGMPRQVTTKYGEKSVLDVVTSEGNLTIWRPVGDMEVMGRRNGERVTVSLDSKGKASLVEHCSTAPGQAQMDSALSTSSRTMGFTAETTPSAPETTPLTPETTRTSGNGSRTAEIADYIQRLGKLYHHCLSTAASMPTSLELDAHSVKDIGTTIFIQTVRHFDL